MAIQVRRGNEANFDPSKMLPGEWAVSLDTKYVRMCFSPGVCLRMATYEGFEADMAQIQQILKDAEDVQAAVEKIQTEVGKTAVTAESYANSARTYSEQSKKYAEESKSYVSDAKEEADRAKMYAENASAVTGVEIATEDRAGIIKGGENHIAEDGTLMLTKRTTETTLHNSHSGGIKINEIGGVSEQASTTGKNLLDYNLFVSKLASNSEGTFVESDGKITITTKADINSGVYAMLSPLGLVDITATLSFDVTISDGTLIKTQIGLTQKNISLSPNVKTRVSLTGYCSSNTAMTFYSGEGVAKTITIENIQVEKGDSATDYEPYTGGIPSPNPDYPQEIKSVEVSEIVAHGGTLATINTSGNNVYIGHVEVGKDYTLCFVQDKQTDFNLAYKSLTSPVKLNKISIGTNVIATFTSEQDADLFFNGYANSNQREFMLIEGMYEEFVPFVPYVESVVTLSNPITLHGIGTAKDRIVRKDGVWGVERNIGTSSARLETTTFDTQTYSKEARFAKPTDMRNTSYLCNIGHTYAFSTWGVDKIGVFGFGGVDYTQLAIRIPVDADAKTITADIVYQLVTPTFEPLPEADQLALHSLKSFDTITYVECDSEVQPTWDLEYGTSRVGARVLELQNENVVLKMSETKSSIKSELLTFSHEDDTNEEMIIGGINVLIVDYGDRAVCSINGVFEVDYENSNISFNSDLLNNKKYSAVYVGTSAHGVELTTGGYLPILGTTELKENGFSISLGNTVGGTKISLNSTIFLTKK